MCDPSEHKGFKAGEFYVEIDATSLMSAVQYPGWDDNHASSNSDYFNMWYVRLPDHTALFVQDEEG